MAKNCCGGPVCACKIVGGGGIDVTGTGTLQDPFVLSGTGGPPGEPGDMGEAVSRGNLSGNIALGAFTLSTQTFRGVLTGNITFAQAGMPVPPVGRSGSFTFRLQQDATGGRTMTLDPTIKRSYGLAPLLTPEANAVDLVHFMWTGLEWVCAGVVMDIR